MPSINDDLSDRFIAHAIYLRRLQTGIVKKIIKVLNQADREMLAKLNARLATGATRGFTTHRLQQLINEVRALNDVAYKALGKTLKSELLDLAEYETDFTKRLLEEPLKRLNFGIDLVGVSPQTLRAVVTATPFQGKLLGQHLSRQNRRRFNAIRTDIQQGVIQGLTNDEMIRRIRGTRAARYSDGVLEVSRREAESLTRTSVAAVTGSSRDELYRANSDIVEGEGWSAILDGRTTLVCQNNSGHTRSLDPETGEWGEWSNGYEGDYPAHWNERSTLIPTLRGYQELGFDTPRVKDDPKVIHTSRVAKTRRQVRKDIRAEVRRDMGPAAWSKLTSAQRERRITRAVRKRYADLAGQVPEGTTYPEWLKKQPKSFVVDVLGARRAEAFLSGRLEIDRFVDDFGKELSLSELGLIDSRGKLIKLADIQSAASIALEQIEDAEDILRRQKIEHALLWDSDGAYLFWQRGTVSMVEFTEEQIEAVARGVLTHNHTRASPFSSKDLVVAFEADIGELRAVGRMPDKRTVLYLLGPPRKGWASLDQDQLVAEVDRRLQAVKQGGDGSIYDRLHQVWVQFAEKFGLRYERRFSQR